jgi:acyl-CoA thioesterase-1
MRVLVFGASITQGFYDTEGGWVSRLRKYYDKRLIANPSQPDITVFNLGISGDGSDRLLKRFRNETDARKFPGEDFTFIFLIGTNNSWVKADGSPISTPQDYAEDIKQLIKQAREYSSRILFMGIAPCDESRTNPVPWNKDIYFSNARLKIFDEVLKKICEEETLSYLPIYEPIVQKLDSGEDLYFDGLHPNDEGHQLIFELVQPELDKLLNT